MAARLLTTLAAVTITLTLATPAAAGDDVEPTPTMHCGDQPDCIEPTPPSREPGYEFPGELHPDESTTTTTTEPAEVQAETITPAAPATPVEATPTLTG